MNKREKIDRPTRSDKYQYLLLETSCSHEMMEAFSNQQSISNLLNPYQYDERIAELMDELKKEFWKMAEKELTDLQKTVLKMRADGYTQCEIANILDVNQSSITKCLNGNTDYKNNGKDGKPKVYGGCVKKLKKLASQNGRIVEILKELDELRNERW